MLKKKVLKAKFRASVGQGMQNKDEHRNSVQLHILISLRAVIEQAQRASQEGIPTFKIRWIISTNSRMLCAQSRKKLVATQLKVLMYCGRP